MDDRLADEVEKAIDLLGRHPDPWRRGRRLLGRRCAECAQAHSVDELEQAGHEGRGQRSSGLPHWTDSVLERVRVVGDAGQPDHAGGALDRVRFPHERVHGARVGVALLGAHEQAGDRLEPFGRFRSEDVEEVVAHAREASS